MTAKRIGAVLVAVALIVIALVVRQTVLDDDSAADPNTAPTTAAPLDAAALVCVTELATACEAVRERFPDLAVRVESAGTTLDDLAAADGPAPMWATIEPFPEMVDALRPGDPPLDYTTEPLGASQLAIALPPGGRAATLTSGCGTQSLWACIGEYAGAPWTELGGDPSWRTIRPSLGRVEREGVALASFAAAVAGYVGSPQISQAVQNPDPTFVTWLRRLSGAVNESELSAGTPLATMATRSGLLDIAATSDAEVQAVGSTRFDVNYPEPSMWVEAVLAVPGGAAAPDGLVAALTAEAGAAGWAASSTAVQKVPDATTMLALRTLWLEATG